MLQSHIVSLVGSELVEPSSDLGKVVQALFSRLAELGFTLRTSGTYGTELIGLNAYKSKLDRGVIPPSRIKVFLPWRGYNTTLQPYGECYTTISTRNYDLCTNFVRTVQRYWSTGTKNTKLLQAKNAMIIFGEKLNRPCDFLITCCPLNAKGEPTGIPSSAIKLALSAKVPVFNLYDLSSIEDTLYELRSYLRGLGYPIVTEAEVVF